eukprot:3612940-Amphidinium_carterae.1
MAKLLRFFSTFGGFMRSSAPQGDDSSCMAPTNHEFPLSLRVPHEKVFVGLQYGAHRNAKPVVFCSHVTPPFVKLAISSYSHIFKNRLHGVESSAPVYNRKPLNKSSESISARTIALSFRRHVYRGPSQPSGPNQTLRVNGVSERSWS